MDDTKRNSAMSLISVLINLVFAPARPSGNGNVADHVSPPSGMSDLERAFRRT